MVVSEYEDTDGALDTEAALLSHVSLQRQRWELHFSQIGRVSFQELQPNVAEYTLAEVVQVHH